MEKQRNKNVTEIVEDNNLNSKGKVSFEVMMKKGNCRFNSDMNSPLNHEGLNSLKVNASNPLTSKTKRKISFIDEKEKNKSIKEVIEIPSYKEYYIDISEDNKNNGCECKIF